MFYACISALYLYDESYVRSKGYRVLLDTSKQIGAWTVMIIYICLNIFQIIAVLKPIFYSTRVTVKHSYVICGLAWIASIAFGILLVVINAYWNSVGLAKFGFWASTTLLVFYFIVAVATYGIITLKAKIT